MRQPRRRLDRELVNRGLAQDESDALGLIADRRVLVDGAPALGPSRMVATSDEWIVQRTGIRQRHMVEKGVATSDLAAEASRRLLERRGISASEIDCIIVATVTPDMFFPSTACILQEKIGARNAWGFDLSAACSGFPYALQVGAKLVESGAHKKVLVIGADTMSSILDYTDRTTCILFGDGAGAVLIEPCESDEVGLIDGLVAVSVAEEAMEVGCRIVAGNRVAIAVEGAANPGHLIRNNCKAIIAIGQ